MLIHLDPELDSAGGKTIRKDSVKNIIDITLQINSIEDQVRGPSHWCFNSSLLNDENYVELITAKYGEDTGICRRSRQTPSLGFD